MIYVDSTGIVTKIFSSADKIISISLKDNQIMITAINYDLIVTIRCTRLFNMDFIKSKTLGELIGINLDGY